ncbi:MAG TPA: hypothetical protein VJU02_04955, partial [Nitrospiraceae bacterium]|nr:hypothetical protein [Nitrospiraceae bacterium]
KIKHLRETRPIINSFKQQAPVDSKPVIHPTHFSLNNQSFSRHPFSILELRFSSQANNLFENSLHRFDPDQRSPKPQVILLLGSSLR